MTLRDRLLAKLREPNYRPASEFTLSRLLNLNKKQQGPLATEVRRLLSSGEARLVQFASGEGNHGEGCIHLRYAEPVSVQMQE